MLHPGKCSAHKSKATEEVSRATVLGVSVTGSVPDTTIKWIEEPISGRK
jgi:hypothetical protein